MPNLVFNSTGAHNDQKHIEAAFSARYPSKKVTVTDELLVIVEGKYYRHLFLPTQYDSRMWGHPVISYRHVLGEKLC